MAAVAPVGAHGVQRIGDADDPDHLRQLPAFQPGGVAFAVEPLVVVAGTLNPLKDKGVAAAYLVMLLCVLFAALFKSCGYILCAVVLSMIIMFLIGKRNWVQMVLVSVLVPLLMWLVFYKVLTVNIPLGPLNFLRTLVDMI